MLSIDFQSRKIIILFFCLLPFISAAQQLERLKPIKVLYIRPISNDTALARQNLYSPSDSLTDFFLCSNDAGTVGYLLKTSDMFEKIFYDDLVKGTLFDNAGLSEVSRAEEVLAEVLNLRADSAQYVEEVFTAPRFYRFIRQYLIYLNAAGDTCAYVNCMMNDDGHLNPDRRFVVVNDGGDNYWQARLNLSRRSLLSLSINGPYPSYCVDGRSNEPRGIKNNVFIDRHDVPKAYFKCYYDDLPQAVRRQLSFIEYRRDCMTDYQRLEILGKTYYLVSFSNGATVGFDRRGRWLYIGKHYVLGLELDELLRFTGDSAVYDAVVRDMAARGRDFKRYGRVYGVERVKGCFVVSVYYSPHSEYNYYETPFSMSARYTIDKQGRIIGIAHHP